MKILYLYIIRKEVVEFNVIVFEGVFMGRKIIVEVIDLIVGDLFFEIKEKILLKILLDSLKIKGLLKFLNFVEDLFGELSINVDVSDGLINGILCIIKKFDYRVYVFKRCSIVWVFFISLDIGKKCRV